MDGDGDPLTVGRHPTRLGRALTMYISPRTEPLMLIHELGQITGLSVKTIRYYESVGVLPAPPRAQNNYRRYTSADVDRLRFVVSARQLGIRLDDLRDIVAARDRGRAPCERVLAALDQCRLEVDRALADMLALRATLRQLRREGAGLPLTAVQGRACVCTLVQASGQASARTRPPAHLPVALEGSQ